MRIDELIQTLVVNTDFAPVSPPALGPGYKATLAQIVSAGLYQPNSSTAGAGANLTIKAADGVTSGAGGSIYITAGSQASTGGHGSILLSSAEIRWTPLSTSSMYLRIWDEGLYSGVGIATNNMNDYYISFHGTSGRIVRFRANMEVYTGVVFNSNTAFSNASGLTYGYTGVTRVTDSGNGGGSFAYTSNTPTALSANTDNLSLNGSAFQRLSSSSAVNLTGIAGTGDAYRGVSHIDGRVIWLHNVGSFNITLKHSQTSTAANQFITETSGDLVLGPNRIVQCTYDGTSAKWRAHGETYPYIFPTADGTNGQVLVTNGSGTLSWSTNGNASASGTTNYVAKFTGTTSLGDGIIYDNGTHVGIGTTTLNQIGGSRTLSINSNLDAGIELNANNTVYGVVYANTNGLGLSGFGAFGMRFYTASAIAGSAERMRIDASGNVGIGTTSTTGKLTVANVGKQLTLKAYDGSQNNTVSFEAIRANYSDAASVLAIYTNSGSSENERVRIMHTGEVGIGTQSPGARLEVSGTVRSAPSSIAGVVEVGSDGGLTLTRDNSYDLTLAQSSSSSNGLYLSGAGNVYVCIDNNNNEADRKFIVSNNAVKATNELFSVNESGNTYASGSLGVGTSSPGAQLQVSTAAAATKGLIVRGFTSQSANLQEWQNSSGTALATVSAAGTLILNPTRSTNPYFQIFPSGDSYNVFKIYSPSASWTGAGSSVVYEMPDSNNTITTTWAGTMQISSTVPIVLKASNIYSNNPYVAVFATNTEVARFTQTGLLGVGTTSPGAMIHATTTAAAAKGLIVRGFTSQSANLQEWQDSSESILSYVDKNGVYFGNVDAASAYATSLVATSASIGNQSQVYRPTLELNLADNKSLTATTGPTPTFSRSSPSTYTDASGIIRTAANNVARFNHVFDGTNWVSKGLLIEEQRTNVITYSEDLQNFVASGSVTANSTIAPDGTLTADTFSMGVGSGEYGLRAFPGTITNILTMSIYAKKGTHRYLQLRTNGSGGYANFDLETGTTINYGASLGSSMINVGNGWYRCICVLSASSPTAYRVSMISSMASGFPEFIVGTGAENFIVWGWQIEEGSFATSYIKSNSGSATTRSADICQITGSDFSGFWNGTEGSFAVEYDRTGIDSTKDSEVFQLTNSSGTNQFYLDGLSGNEFLLFYTGATVANLALGSVQSAGTSVKASIAYKVNDFAGSRNGGNVATDLSGAVPVVDRLSLGRDTAAGLFYLNGHIARLRYYPVRLPNVVLQDLSSNAPLKIYSSSYHIGLAAPSSLSASTTYTLPSTDGTSGQFLVTNGTGTMSWSSTLPSGGSVSGTTNYVAKFTGSAAVGNSQIFDNGTNVGIGTASPSYKLHVSGQTYLVNGSSNPLYIEQTVADGTTRDSIYLYEASAQGTGRQAISWYNGNTGYYKARIYTEVGPGYNATKFYIDTADNARTVATRLCISNGNIGIGTTAPDTAVVIKVPSSGTVNALKIEDKDNTNALAYLSFTNASDEGGLSLYKTNVIKAYIRANGASYLIGGNFGVGTSSPGAQLEVATQAAATKGLIVKGFTSQSANLQEWQNSAGTALGYINSDMSLLVTPATFTLGSQSNNSGVVELYSGTVRLRPSSLGNYILTLTQRGVDVTGGVGDTTPVLKVTRNADANVGPVAQFVTGSTTHKGITVVGVASQTGNLQEWQNSSGTALAQIDAAGSATVVSLDISGPANLQMIRTKPNSVSYSRFLYSGSNENILYGGPTGLGVNNFADSVRLFNIADTGATSIALTSAAAKGLIVKGFTSQSANLQEWQDSSANRLSAVTSNGTISGKFFEVKNQYVGQSGQPTITFTGAGNVPIALKVLDDSYGTLSFEGSAGQLFSINNNLASGIIFSVNDISGIPQIDVNADGTIRLAPFASNIVVAGMTVGIGTGNVNTNTVLGNTAWASNTTGSQSTAIGYGAGNANTTGGFNTYVGIYAGRYFTTASNNTSVGAYALYGASGSSTGSNNTALGYYALVSNTSGTHNVGLGSQALYNTNSGLYNIGIGHQAGYTISSGSSNVAIGHMALNSASTGSSTAVGFQSLYNTTGTANTAVGYYALRDNTTGTGNVAIGDTAGRYQSDGSSLTTTTNSIYIGNAVRGLNNSDNNSIVIGANAIGKGGNTTVLGNTSTTQAWIYGTGIIYNSGGNNYSENLRLPESSLGWSVIHMGGAAATSGTGANQWTILKADSASSHRFEIRHNTTAVVSILTNGNVGIGTTSQTSKFQVNNNGATGSAFYVDIGNPSNATTLFEHTGANTPVPFRLTKSGAAGSGSYGLLDLFYDTNTAGHGSNLYFSLDDSAGNITEYGGIGARINANTNGSERGDLYFYTMNTGTGRAEQMVLRYDGNLGIGTTNPTAQLHLAKAGQVQFDMQNTTTGGTPANGAHWRTFVDNVGGGGGNLTYGFYDFRNSRVAMGIDNSGNVGINTTSPAAKLHVSQSTAGAIGLQVSMPTGAETTQAGIRVFGYSPAIELMDKDSIQNWYMGIDDNDSNKLLFGRGYGPGQGVTQAMTIDVNDNVGIGTTAPGNRLHVDGGANLPIRTVSSTFSGMECHITNGTWKAFIGTESGGGGNRYNSADNQHTFYNNSTAVMRINSSGYVGIGTTGPTKSLTIAQNGSAPGVLIYKSPDGTLNASQLTAALGSGSSFTNSGTSGGNEYGICQLFHNGTTRVQLYAYDVGVGNSTNFALDAFTFGAVTSFAQVGVVAKSASTPVIISRGFTSQTAPLMTYQDSSANALGYIAANGLDSSTFNDYTWTPNYAGGVNSPSTASYRKSSGNSNVWDGHVYSSEGFAKNVHVTFKASQTNAYLMVGLNSDPAADANYSSLDYAWYPRNDGILEIYESNASIGTFGAYTTSTVLSVVYDGTNVIYLKDGTIMRTVARAVGSLLYLDSSFYTLNGAVNSVRFGQIGTDIAASARIITTQNSASALSTYNVAKTVIGGLHFNNGAGANGSSRNEAAITFQGQNANEAQAGIYVLNDNSNGTLMGFATTDSYATGPQLGMTISNTGAISFPRAATINTPATCSIGSTGNNGGVLSLGASYFGLRITSLNGDIINGNVNTVNITPGAGGNTTGLNVTGNMGASGIVAGFTNVGSASSKVMVVKGQTSQSGNLQEWQNSSGTVLASADSAGNISTPRLIAPIHSSSSSLQLWHADNVADAASSGISFGYSNWGSGYMPTHWTFKRTLPDTSGNFVELFSLPGQQASYFELTVVAYKHAEAFESKSYVFATQYLTGGGILQPTFSHNRSPGFAGFFGNHFEVELNTNVEPAVVRVRRTSTSGTSVAIFAHLRGMHLQGITEKTGTGTSSISLSSLHGTQQVFPTALAPPVVSSGAGNNIGLYAGSGVSSGAGGSVILQPGAQATSGGNGNVVVRQPGGSAGTDEIQLSHDGGKGSIINKDGVLQLGGANIAIRNVANNANTTLTATVLYATGLLSSDSITADGVVSDTYSWSLDSSSLNWNQGFHIRVSWSHIRSYGCAGIAYTGNNTNGRYSTLEITDGSSNGGALAYRSTDHTISANTNDLTPTRFSAVQRWSPTANYNVTGLAAGGSTNFSGGAPTSWIHTNGRVIWVHNVATAYNITLKHEDAGSTAGNRFLTETGTDIILPPNSMVMLTYDGTSSRWRVHTLSSAVKVASSTNNISTATNDLALSYSNFQRLNCTTACNLTGVAPPSGGVHTDGRIMRIVNTGTANLTLVHNSASSATANRFFNVAGANLVIAPNDYAELMYDATDNGRATSSPGWRVY